LRRRFAEGNVGNLVEGEKKLRLKILVAGLSLAGVTASAQAPSKALTAIAPEQAIAMAAKSSPSGVRGTFVMQVRATGKAGGHVFLNSEQDYRDPKNLSIDIAPWIKGQLERRFGDSPESFFKNKQIVVRGTAVRVPIRILDDYHRPTPPYVYYQTHVRVLQASQISLPGQQTI
jgi:hypothetical protein